MSRKWTAAWAVVAGLSWASGEASAQYAYPGGYGRYGWGGWGADPGSGYMAGLGSFARGQGAYQVDEAKARSINADTMIRWNKALRARQKELQADQQKEDAREAAARANRIARADLEDGVTLNAMLMRIMDFDPAVAKSSQSKTPVPAAAIREIPFQWNTEAITLCLDQMTATDALPSPLRVEQLAPQREELGLAVKAAIEEDAKGDVSAKATKRLNAAIAALRAAYRKIGDGGALADEDPEEYFTAMAGLSRLLHDPGMRKALALLEGAENVNVGRLVAFMQAYNLRFGPATTPRQLDIYEGLAPLLARVAADLDAPTAPAPAVEEGGKPLQAAAKGVFKGMSWAQLEDQASDR